MLCPGLDLYCTDPAQTSHNGTLGSIDVMDGLFVDRPSDTFVDHLSDISVDLSDISVDHLSDIFVDLSDLSEDYPSDISLDNVSDLR